MLHKGMKRKWLVLLILILAMVWIFNVSRPGYRVDGCFDGCATTNDQTDKSIRIVSLNMLHGFPKFEHLMQRLMVISGEIERLDADIVILQEVPWTIKTGSAAQFLAEQTGMNHAYVRANGNRWTIFFEEGEAVLSRYPLINPEFMVLQPKAGFFENRIVLNITVDTPEWNIDLYVTHLTHGEADINFEQTQSLFEFIEDDRKDFAVVAGDFNAEPDSAQIKNLQSYWIDAYSLFNPGVDGITCCIDNITEKEANPDKRIDYIFAALDGLTPTVIAGERVFTQPFQVESGWLWASDHIGMMVEFAAEK